MRPAKLPATQHAFLKLKIWTHPMRSSSRMRSRIMRKSRLLLLLLLLLLPQEEEQQQQQREEEKEQ